MTFRKSRCRQGRYADLDEYSKLYPESYNRRNGDIMRKIDEQNGELFSVEIR